MPTSSPSLSTPFSLFESTNMRSTSSLILLALAGSSVAFPAGADKRSAEAAGCPFAVAGAKRQGGILPAVTFDPAKQKIDVTGAHAFQPPGPSDKRGPCPGLNALANHGYLPRNGVTTLTQAAGASNKVYGMGIDLCTVLATIAVFFAGDVITQEFSIGNSPSGPVFLPFLSVPLGLSGTHNKFEGDASPGRGDAYLHNGDSSSLDIDNFKALYDLQPEGPSSNYNMDVLTTHRNQTFHHSIENNPYFFYGPFSGFVVSHVAHPFIPAFMSNHSAEAPDGVLNGDVLKSFFSVSGSSGNLTYKWGNERIPDNWYRRLGDYGLAQAAVDGLTIASKIPQTLSIGGNTGTVNSYAGVDVSDLTGGVFNAANLLEGNNSACFMFRVIEVATPSMLEGLISNIATAVALISEKIAPQFDKFNCPQLSKYDTSLFKKYPGAGSGL
ncbi:hypothetical protein BDV93DRAFT_607177 [Ceratobasidium sp. AG-I]|nr:hypothetical protein BDV93DRAFT_607177 [Ceratobasidium sp. AG-I]